MEGRLASSAVCSDNQEEIRIEAKLDLTKFTKKWQCRSVYGRAFICLFVWQFPYPRKQTTPSQVFFVI